MSEHLYVVIMAGGSGTRFWPLSRQKSPKQLQAIVGETPLIRSTVERFEGMVPPENIFVITGPGQDEPTRRILTGIRPGNVIAEPEGRDTSAAIALGATVLLKRDPEAMMAVVPADHLIKPRELFQATVAAAADVAARTDYLILFGIRPSFPSTGFGYIRFGDRIETASGGMAVRQVRGFTEKPDERTARDYLESKEYHWNSGIFVWRAARILREISACLPGHGQAFEKIGAALGTPAERKVLAEEYARLRKISIDYAVLEKASGVAVLEAGYEWDDVGSWLALERHMDRDQSGNVVLGDAISMGSTGCIIHSSGKRLVAALDLTNMLVVDTDDVVLICPKNRDQDVKKMVDEVRRRGKTELL
ncbi:MAG TPA: sugar phosphate nucleotidyltransferase [Planctomycetota bacterium]|nr:sugar phosphate nucleotidyltransferase [Planctomycetota bacterium]